MQIFEIEFATPEYDEAVHLRYEVLRRPLGLEFTPEQLAAEYSDRHLAAFDSAGRLVACLCLTPAGDGAIKMRQVAVAPEWQGKGIGSRLVEASEELAARSGFRRMVLHARAPAVPFYERLDYHVVGDMFEEVTIPHYKMVKILGGEFEN